MRVLHGLAAAVLWTGAGLSARAADWEPEQWPAPAPGVYAGPVEVEETGALAALWRWYRARSDRDGARCPYYPTCSGFARTSVRRHGLVVGGWLAADRLMREYPGMAEVDHYPLVTPHGHPRFLDPVPEAVIERRDRAQAADTSLESPSDASGSGAGSQ